MKKITFIVAIWAIALRTGSVQAQFHGIDTNWYATPVQFMPSVIGASAGGAVANNMVVKSNGTVIIFYRENNQQNFWAGSSDGGNTWTNPSPTAVTPCQGMVGTSPIGADIDTAGNIHIVWKAEIPQGLFYANYNANTQSWSAYQQINNAIYTSLQFSMITTDRKGRLHVMWQDGNHNATSDTSRVFYVRSTDGGNTWSSQMMLSDASGKDDAFPVADFGGTHSDTLIIPWRQNTGGGLGWEVKGAISTNGGQTWGSPVTLSGGTGDQWDPVIIMDKNGIAHLFHHLYPNPNPDYMAYIHYRYSADGGNTWSALDTISDIQYRSHLIKAAYDYTNNAVWCFWKDERDFNFTTGNPEADIIGSYIINNGTSYTVSPTEFISDGDTTEYGYHNFKIGMDGIVRAHFVTIESGQPKDLYYTQRSALFDVGIVEQLSNDISTTIYPNPFSNVAIIQTDKDFKNATLDVYNSFGQIVRQIDNLSGQSIIFHRNNLASGLYFIRLTQDNKVITTNKLVITN